MLITTSQYHSETQIQVLASSSKPFTSKTGKTSFSEELQCAVHGRDKDGNSALKVGTIKSFSDTKPEPVAPGFYYPIYEPATQWDDPSIHARLVALVVVKTAASAASAPSTKSF